MRSLDEIEEAEKEGEKLTLDEMYRLADYYHNQIEVEILKEKLDKKVFVTAILIMFNLIFSIIVFLSCVF